MPVKNDTPLFNEFHEMWNKTSAGVQESVELLKSPSSWSILSTKKDAAEEITKEVFIEELPTPKECNFDLLCTIEELMFRVVMLQAYYCRRVQETLEKIRPTLMQFYSGENEKQCNTYGTWGAKSWKYLGAGLQVAGAIIPFSGTVGADAAKLASKGLAGTGAASSGVGSAWDEHYTGLRTGYQHAEGNMRKLVENNDRSSTNVYSSIEVLSRLIADIANKMHQNKTEMVR